MTPEQFPSDQQQNLHSELSVLPEPWEIEEQNNADLPSISRYGLVLASPARAFAGLLRTKSKMAIILLGALISFVIYGASMVILSSSPDVLAGLKKQQSQRFEKMYDAGKIPKKSYDEMMDKLDTWDQGAYLTQAAFGLIAFPIFWMIFALIIMVVARVLEASHDEGMTFMAAWCVLMISSVISSLDLLVRSVGAFITGNSDFSLSAGMFVESENLIVKFALGLSNPLGIWGIIVTGIGIAVLSRSTKAKGIIAWAGVWIVGGLVLSGIGQLLMGMFMGGS